MFLNQRGIMRGKILIDYAFSKGDRPTSITLSDMVGIVAAYIATGRYTGDMEKTLSALLNPAIGSAAHKTFEVFDASNGSGFWSQGPAMDDIAFTRDKLQLWYPKIGLDWTNQEQRF